MQQRVRRCLDIAAHVRRRVDESGGALEPALDGGCFALCGNQSFEAAPLRGKLMLFRQRFPDARRGGAEIVRLVRAGAESVTTRPR